MRISDKVSSFNMKTEQFFEKNKFIRAIKIR